jgi:hypothetical protein
MDFPLFFLEDDEVAGLLLKFVPTLVFTPEWVENFTQALNNCVAGQPERNGNEGPQIRARNTHG